MARLQLTQQEAELLLELLETERQELPPVIDHANAGRLRDMLFARLRLVELLNERLEAAVSPKNRDIQ